MTRNISSLFKTAQMEVQRKVEEIKQLRQRSAALNSASLDMPLSPTILASAAGTHCNRTTN